MKRTAIIVTTLLFLLIIALPAAAGAAYPQLIPLPTAFRPEGIALGTGHTFYAGSLADGTILVGDLRTGATEELVPGAEGRFSVGMSVDRRSGYLFVAGGPNAVGRVYDTRTGALLAEYPMTGGQAGNFINDVIVTRSAAYFTNSFAPYIYRVPLGPAGALPAPADVAAIELSGDWAQQPGFNANGIEATPNGRDLIVVSSAAQAIYRVDPTSGSATQIDLGGDTIPNGDGLVLLGQTLYVVQNQLNQIGVITLAPDLTSGAVGQPITSTFFNVPTTALAFGSSLYVVNAKFGAPPAVTDYEIVKVPRR